MPGMAEFTHVAKERGTSADMLFAVLKVIAYEVDLATELIATRDDLQVVVRLHKEDRLDRNNLPLMQGWRYDIAGRQLCGLLDGAPLLVAIDNEQDPPVTLKFSNSNGTH